MDSQAAIPGRQLGMVAPARAARVGKYEDAFEIVHERRSLGKVGRCSTVLDDKARALADDAAGAAGYLGDQVRSKLLNDLIEGAGHRR